MKLRLIVAVIALAAGGYFYYDYATPADRAGRLVFLGYAH